MVKVVIADDEEYVRVFLNALMQSLSFEVVGEVENGAELPSMMQETQPDLLLLDINMPNLTGIEFLREYGHKFPKTCVIILTSESLVNFIGEESISHVKCFLRKGTPVEEMLQAIVQTLDEFKKQGPKRIIPFESSKQIYKKKAP